MKTGILVAAAALAAVGFAQDFRCGWSVNGGGGASMSSSAYRGDATAGQTAAGIMTGSAYQAFVGFWQTEAQTGVKEEAERPGGQVMRTRLYAPRPNPARGSIVIRYALDTESPVLLQVHDIAGRVACTLVASSMKRGAYSVSWDGRDGRGRRLSGGVYFVRLVAGGCRATEKLLLAR